ncbi:MAG: HIT family protein [Hyphomicrobiaceae bacterium]|nr:HIT family protein [Hyphomicrobiaceae bacterium]
MTYDDSNVFAKILRGELPCHKVYEDDKTFAFMDIMPRAHGHTLVIPKSAATDLIDVSPETLCDTVRTVQRIAPAIRDSMEADGLLIQQFNGAAAGQTVFHVHFHIIPRFEGVALLPHAGDMGDPEVLAVNAEKIRQAIEAA